MILPFILKLSLRVLYAGSMTSNRIDEIDALRDEFLLGSDDTAPPPDDVVTKPVSS
jgi:hypothetical protein